MSVPPLATISISKKDKILLLLFFIRKIGWRRQPQEGTPTTVKMPPPPLALSENQVYIVPVGAMYYSYAEKVASALHSEGIRFALDLSSDTMLQKTLHGENDNFNYIVFVARHERDSDSVSIRTWDNSIYGMKTIAEFIKQLKTEMVS
jgi:threonyl-tRNA synthetase